MVDNGVSSSTSPEYSYPGVAGGSTAAAAVASSEIKEQDRLLPIANVGRLMKQNLPPNAKISKEAKETMQECVSEFIAFVTGEASEKCHREKRKTVNGDDICWALGTLGFDDYVEPLKRYLRRYRDLEGERPGHSSKASSQNQPPQPRGKLSCWAVILLFYATTTWSLVSGKLNNCTVTLNVILWSKHEKTSKDVRTGMLR
ncbi:hypothetical protein H6P81_015082 [Aristolochia fimbriata]|uniref:Transcription factor CBF/NF-Y/archaeal histone domain-containing protein n=1 Tax=Aristolochia fimbriata TaxID=158543 RepID=A0AAV7E8B3_ARIFI|nr:hypothetical protein H6P81_015082 [Aristolochia fimbriata]